MIRSIPKKNPLIVSEMNVCFVILDLYYDGLIFSRKSLINKKIACEIIFICCITSKELSSLIFQYVGDLIYNFL